MLFVDGHFHHKRNNSERYVEKGRRSIAAVTGSIGWELARCPVVVVVVVVSRPVATLVSSMNVLYMIVCSYTTG